METETKKLSAVGKRRLLKLADHLEKGPKKAKWAHKKFNYAFFDSEDGEMNSKYHCGTAGCAIGECPAVFPRYWKFQADQFGGFLNIILNNDFSRYEFQAAQEFFKINEGEAEYLFNPGGAWWAERYKNHLSNNATAKQVAKHIRKFVKARS
jgi:hypothetical protein